MPLLLVLRVQDVVLLPELPDQPELQPEDELLVLGPRRALGGGVDHLAAGGGLVGSLGGQAAIASSRPMA